MRKKRWPSLRFIVATTAISLLMLLTPGFECKEFDTDPDGLFQRVEGGFYSLSFAPETVTIPAGGSQNITFSFFTTDPDFVNQWGDPSFDAGALGFKLGDTPTGLSVSPLEEQGWQSGTYRESYEVRAEGLTPGIYYVPVDARGLSGNFDDPTPFNIYAERTLTVTVIPRGIGGTASATQLAGGAYHSLAILSDGSVWSWGLNNKGQLGDGTTVNRLAPVPVQGLPGSAVAVAAGGAHSLALLDDGTIWGWGDNREKQLYLGGSEEYLLPIRTTGAEMGAVALAAGAAHSVLLTADGSILTRGANDLGQLGRRSAPEWHPAYEWHSVDIDIPRVFTAIAASSDFSAAIDNQGRVWGWGDNASGQLGWDSSSYVLSPIPVGIFDAVAIAAGESHLLALKSDGTVSSLGSDSYGSGSSPTTVPGLSGVVEIAAGSFHSLALTADGIVYGWGEGGFGQLAIPQIDPSLPAGSPQLVTPLAEASTIAAGGRHSFAMVTQCATLLSWGDNGAGQLGDGTGQSSALPVKVIGIGEDGSRPGCDVTLSVIIVGKGKVTSEPEGIDCGDACGALFAPGTTVSLTAEPELGWSFRNWDGDASGTERTTFVTVDTSKICIAYFSSQPVPPVARFTVSPDYPLTTDTVVFNASESYDNGWIALYEWDFDNDGQFDVFRSRTSVDAVFSAEFVTNSWTGGTHTIKLRVTDNDGMSDETTGAIHVREPEPPRYDLGDAPDSSNTIPGQPPMLAYPQTGVVARYPTVYRAGSPPYGPIHRSPRSYFYLGKDVTLENEADVGVDADSTNNIAPVLDSADRDVGDDGIQMPAALPHCGWASMDCTITVVDPPHQYIYVNVWFDWNRDGDWNDVLECPDGSKVPEWGIKNEEQYLYDSGSEKLRLSFKCWHPSDQAVSDPMWMRVTLSEERWSSSASRVGGSGPQGGYEYGETEDYYIQP